MLLSLVNLSKRYAIITKQHPEINYRNRSLALKLKVLVFNVNFETNIIKMKVIEAANKGLRNHDRTIYPSFVQLRFEKPEPIIPAPSKAPTTVCVPEIGIPENDEVMMNEKEAKHTENIIFF